MSLVWVARFEKSVKGFRPKLAYAELCSTLWSMLRADVCEYNFVLSQASMNLLYWILHIWYW